MDSSDSEDDIPRKAYTYRKRMLHTEDPREFRERYRLTPRLFDLLFAEIGNQLEKQTDRSHALSSKESLLAALRFFSSGHFYYSLADCQGMFLICFVNVDLCFLGLSKMTICNAVKEVTSVINVGLSHYVGWPTTQEERDRIPIDFHRVAELDNICGVVDGTHIRIEAPAVDEAQYVNRHHQHSLNVMGVCGPMMDLYFLSARWPGSVNDARVLRQSSMFTPFQRGWRPFPNAILIG
jgi:hypothetical protein